MGCGVSTATTNPAAALDEKSVASRVEWKMLPSSDEARKKFEADGTLSKNSDPGHLELRAILDEPLAQHTLGKYAKDKKALDIFMCWVDIQEYKSIPTEDFRRSKALHVYHKYVKDGAILDVGVDPVEKTKYKEDIDNSKHDKELLQPSFFDKIQMKCFLEIYHNIFIPFKQTEMYTSLTTRLKQKYNNVKPEDFIFFRKLGEGGFGLVVHCMKKSTRKHYAMKIQTKKGLLDCFSDDPWRADFEKQAFAACQHPFIVNLDYAFQSDTLAIMVLGLANAGDLQKALLHAPEERLPEDRVQFYAAEVVLALSYLHQMGLMYRDLKPNNILLNSDGHIQLVDLGGVVDEKGKTLGLQNEARGLAPLFAQKFNRQIPREEDEDGNNDRHHDDEDLASTNTARPKRRLSIMGTFGYMAPEMVIMLSQTSVEKVGYTNSVDWWSLGVTIFKLLTGFRPFTEENFNAFVEMASTMNGRYNYHDTAPEYAMLFQEIPFPSYMSPMARDLISKLLDVNEKTRLGSGPGGVDMIKAHPFFRGIDWDLLEQKHIEPPYKPEVKPLDETPVYPNFETMMKDLNKEQWVREYPKKDEQKYFVHWDFTSPQTLRIEFGIANEMEQYDRNFKIRQLMGDKNEMGSGSKRTIQASTQSRKK